MHLTLSFYGRLEEFETKGRLFLGTSSSVARAPGDDFTTFLAFETVIDSAKIARPRDEKNIWGGRRNDFFLLTDR